MEKGQNVCRGQDFVPLWGLALSSQRTPTGPNYFSATLGQNGLWQSAEWKGVCVISCEAHHNYHIASRFIPILNKVTKVKELSPTAQIWALHYKFPFPVSKRIFTVLQVVHEENTNPPSGSRVISLPIRASLISVLQIDRLYPHWSLGAQGVTEIWRKGGKSILCQCRTRQAAWERKRGVAYGNFKWHWWFHPQICDWKEHGQVHSRSTRLLTQTSL